MGNVQASNANTNQQPFLPDGYFGKIVSCHARTSLVILHLTGVRVTGDAMRDILVGEKKVHEEQLNRAVKNSVQLFIKSSSIYQ